jgi:glucose 1-dehydrogenase
VNPLRQCRYQQAAEALAKADHDWLLTLIARTVSLDDWASALERRQDDVKPVIRFGENS